MHHFAIVAACLTLVLPNLFQENKTFPFFHKEIMQVVEIFPLGGQRRVCLLHSFNIMAAAYLGPLLLTQINFNPGMDK